VRGRAGGHRAGPPDGSPVCQSFARHTAGPGAGSGGDASGATPAAGGPGRDDRDASAGSTVVSDRHPTAAGINPVAREQVS
jgi:hypothetical protein